MELDTKHARRGKLAETELGEACDLDFQVSFVAEDEEGDCPKECRETREFLARHAEKGDADGP